MRFRERRFRISPSFAGPAALPAGADFRGRPWAGACNSRFVPALRACRRRPSAGGLDDERTRGRARRIWRASGRRRREGVRDRLLQFATQSCVALAEFELADQLREPFAFVGERPAGRRGLFGHRRVLLRHLVHLVDRVVDLGKARRLLLGVDSDVGYDLIELGHLLGDLLQRLARLVTSFAP